MTAKTAPRTFGTNFQLLYREKHYSPLLRKRSKYYPLNTNPSPDADYEIKFPF